MTNTNSPASGALPADICKPFGYVRDNCGDGHVFQHAPFSESESLTHSTAEVYSRAQMLAAPAPAPVAPTLTAILQMTKWLNLNEFSSIDEMQGAWKAVEKLKSLSGAPVAPTPAQPSQWQPIETAPMGNWGETLWILVHCVPAKYADRRAFSPKQFVAYRACALDGGHPYWGLAYGAIDTSSYRPTHWMPLPSEPEGEK